MGFLETVEEARAFLERNGRVSLRALQRQFNLEDGALDELVEELVEIQRVAVRDGRALQTAEPRRTPRAYTPKHLADKILTQRSAIEGERKQVTVLFADVKSSMELAEELGPEEWHGILDRFFAIANQSVHRFEGTVNQYTGDGVMALFGAPIAHEDHVQRACYGALHMRDALRGYADELRLERGLSLATRMGLNSGEVVVGKIGDDLRMDYTAQGQVVNIAQRMEQLAESGRVYLTKQTADRASGYFRLREIGPTRIKGVPEPVGVYELEDVGEFQGRFDVSLARGLSRFVGREREMAQLEAALERGLQDRCRFVGIVAEAGTGKSRLTYEFSKRCQARGLRLITAGCPPHGRSIALGLSMAATRSWFGVLESDDRETARNKVAGQMSRADPALAADVPFMLDFLGLEESESSPVALDSEARTREIVRITERLLVPLDFQVLIFEDQHWVDPPSETVRVQISRTDLPNPRLKIFTYRPEYRPAEADWPEFEELRLKPLTAASSAELVLSLLGPDPSVKGLERLIQERAAGNPFFVEEIVHSLVESGQLEGARGSYRLLRAVDEVEVPDSVQAVLAARIDRLDERAKRTLQAAAVIGLEFPVSMLAELAEIPQGELDAILHTLATADLAYQLAAYPEIEYAFQHPLTQAVAYDTQLGAPRRRTHAGIARLLEGRHADKLDEKAGLIAYHWEEAGEGSDAARWHARAAGWLETRDVDEALRHWQKTRSQLSGERDLSSDAAELATVACTHILNLGWRQGMSEEEAARVFEEGRERAIAGGSTKAHADLLDSYAIYRGLLGELDDLRAYNADAFELAAELDDPSLVLALECNRVYGMHLEGRLQEAFEASERALGRIEELGLADARGSNGFHLVSNLRLQAGANQLCMGWLEEARASLEESLALALHCGDPDSTCFAYQYLAECCVERGDVESALRYGRAGVEAAKRHTSGYSGVWTDVGLARALIAGEQLEEACGLLEERLADSLERRTALHGEGVLSQLLAEGHLGLGQLGRARAGCDRAIAVARRNGTRLWECDAQLLLARILLRADAAPGEVAAAVERAGELIEQTGAEGRRPRLDDLRAAQAREPS